jgi:uroporphyrinogen-III decarboxylase
MNGGKMMTGRERFLRVMRFEKADRAPFFEFMSYWPETLDRWYKEGLPKGVNINEFFGFDHHEYIPIDFDIIPRLTEKMLAEDDQTRTVVDSRGVTKREFKTGSAMPHFLAFPISDRRSYKEYIERLDPTDPKRYPHDWDGLILQYAHRDYPLGLNIRGPFAFARDFIEFEELMMMFYDDADLMREMFQFHADFLIALWEKALKDVEVDFVVMGEDMAYKTGPMISPETVREFLLPAYRRITHFLREKNGVEVIIVDSDGDIRSLIPIFLEAGINGILPMEVNANSDPYFIAKEYGGIPPVMIGGVDKMKVMKGRDAIKKELNEKLPFLLERGGYIPSIDHLVPPDIALDDYLYYLELLKSMLWA